MVVIPIDSAPSAFSYGEDVFSRQNTSTAILQTTNLSSDINLIKSSSRDVPATLHENMEPINLSSSMIESVEEITRRDEYKNDLSLKNRSISNVPSIDTEIIQLISKVREDLNRLREHIKLNEPSKLINILIMDQQLNIIEPIFPAIIEPESSMRTTSDILKIPKNMHNTTRKKKGLKISYGVMSDKQIIEEMEQRELDHLKLTEERRADENAKSEKIRIMKEAKEELAKETNRLKLIRNKVKVLEADVIAERKRVAVKRRSQNNKTKKSKQLIIPELLDKNNRNTI